MPPLRGRSRRRGEVSPRRGRDYSPRRRRVIRSRDRDREDTFSARDKRERFANTLKSNAANLAAKNTQRQKARLNAANKRGIGLLPNSLKDQLKNYEQEFINKKKITEDRINSMAQEKEMLEKTIKTIKNLKNF